MTIICWRTSVDDGGELPKHYVQEVLQKALFSNSDHLAIQDALLRLNSNALFGLEGNNVHAKSAYKAMTARAAPNPNWYGGRSTTIEAEEIKDQILYHNLCDIRPTCVELSLLSSDDLEIDSSVLVCLSLFNLIVRDFTTQPSNLR